MTFINTYKNKQPYIQDKELELNNLYYLEIDPKDLFKDLPLVCG